MENNFQCTGSDTGISTECSSETTYCQNITTNKFTFKSCGIMDFGHEIDGQDECILDFVRNFRLKIINYTLSLHNTFSTSGVSTHVDFGLYMYMQVGEFRVSLIISTVPLEPVCCKKQQK